jgi:hypothetical protein
LQGKDWKFGFPAGVTLLAPFFVMACRDEGGNRNPFMTAAAEKGGLQFFFCQ